MSELPSGSWDGVRAAVFAPVERLGRVDSIVERLTEAIALGVLRDGERLPSESQLAAQLGVSTVSLREALMALRQQGLVETRRGRGGGTFVLSPPDALKTELAARVRSLSLEDLREAQDHYTAIAGATARLAAERAAPEDVQRMREAAEAFEGARSLPEFRRADGWFHIEVAVASQSVRLTQAEVGCQADIGGLLWLPERARDEAAKAAEDHGAIIEAIHAADGRRARDLAEQHITDAITLVAELRLQLLRA